MVRTFQLTKALSRLTVLQNMLLGATRQPGENLFALAGASRCGRHARSEITEQAEELLDAVQARRQERRLRGLALRRSAQAPRDGAGPHDEARRMVMLDEPMAGVNPALTQSLLGHIQAAARRGHDRAVRRARHAHGPAHLRLGGRHGRGQDRRRGPARGRHAGPGRRSTPTWAPTTTPTSATTRCSGRGVAEQLEAEARGRGGEAMTSTTAAPTTAADQRASRCCTPTDLVAGYLPGVNILNGCNLDGAPGRARRHHRPQRRRQVDAAQGPVRPGARPLRHRDARAARTSPTTRPTRLVRRGVGFVPQNNNVFPSLTDRGEPADGRVPAAQDVRRAVRVHHRPVPDARGAAQAARGLAVGR